MSLGNALSPRARALVALADMVVVTAILIVCLSLHDSMQSAVRVMLPVIVAPWSILALSLTGSYRVLTVPGCFRWIRVALTGMGLAISGVLVAAYLMKVSEQLPRLVIVPWACWSACGLVMVRLIVEAIRLHGIRSGRGSERILLIGPQESRARFLAHLGLHPELGAVVVSSTAQLPGELPELLALRLDRVVICGALDQSLLIVPTLAALRDLPLPVAFAPDLHHLPVFGLQAETIRGLPLLHLSASPLSEQQQVIKALMDLVLGWLLLILFSPLMLIIATILKFSGSGAVLFAQDRHGLGGRVIRVFKFRTMRAKPDKAGPGTGSFRPAVENDPRITAFGRFLRNTSLDELPQFLNVVRGEMSIVGPRPHAILHNKEYTDEIGELMRRHYVKPGITGLAQISGARGATLTTDDMRRRVALDLEYMRTWSVWLDLRIMVQTAFAGWVNTQP